MQAFRENQLRDLLDQPKEVQTGYELMEQFLADLESQKEQAVRDVQAARRLQGVDLLRLQAQAALERQPRFRTERRPIVHMMRNVREGKSTQPPKTLAKTLHIIAEIVQARLTLLNNPTRDIRQDYQNQEHFYWQFMCQKYGVDTLALRYMEQWLVSFQVHADKDARVDLYYKFLGLGGPGSLPFSIFAFYVGLLKAANVQISEVYARDITQIQVGYLRVKLGLRDLLAKADRFTRNRILSQLSKCAKVVALNPAIRRGVDFVLYETYRDVVERMLKSDKYRSFGDVLSQLFRQEARKRGRAPSGGSSRGRGRDASRRVGQSRTALSLSVGRVDRSSARGSARSRASALKHGGPDASWSAAAALAVHEHSSPSRHEAEESEVGAGLPLDVAVPGTLGARARTQGRERGLGTVDSESEDGRSSRSRRSGVAGAASFREAREADRETVTFEALATFLLAELGASSGDEFRLRELLEVILIQGQGVADRDKITRRAALAAFSEKIDIQLPLHQFFHIGVNAAIDHENAENSWHEKVFNFYQQLTPVDRSPAAGLDPDHRLKLNDGASYDGLEFVQFYIFVKDGESKYARDAVALYAVYEDQCEQKGR